MSPEKSPGKSMQGTMTDLVGGPADLDLTIFEFHLNIAVDRLFQFAFRTF